MWSFSYSGDPYKSGPLDLRYLNERVAGESGFIGLSKDKESFVLGNGKPVRFWACNTFVYRRSFDELKAHARFLAKIGVNMVRMHGTANPKEKGSPITAYNEENLEEAWKLVAAMKEQGIYTTISPWWPHNITMGDIDPEADWGIEDYKQNDEMWGLIFFIITAPLYPGSSPCRAQR